MGMLSPHSLEDRPLTWREIWILGKRPDHSGTDEDWLKWHNKYKNKIDTKYFMPGRFTNNVGGDMSKPWGR
jgi:hypothetical protein